MAQFKILVDVPRKLDEPVTTEVQGVKGPGCQQLTEGLEALGGSKLSEETTEEYYEQPVEQSNRLTQHGG